MYASTVDEGLYHLTVSYIRRNLGRAGTLAIILFAVISASTGMAGSSASATPITNDVINVNRCGSYCPHLQPQSQYNQWGANLGVAISALNQPLNALIVQAASSSTT